MGRFSSLSFLLISALLLLSFSHGSGRKLMQTFGSEEDSVVPTKENARFSRVLTDYYDYGNTEANTNQSGYKPTPSETPNAPPPGC